MYDPGSFLQEEFLSVSSEILSVEIEHRRSREQRQVDHPLRRDSDQIRP
jgi:hypothetical protein